MSNTCIACGNTKHNAQFKVEYDKNYNISIPVNQYYFITHSTDDIWTVKCMPNPIFGKYNRHPTAQNDEYLRNVLYTEKDGSYYLNTQFYMLNEKDFPTTLQPLNSKTAYK